LRFQYKEFNFLFLVILLLLVLFFLFLAWKKKIKKRAGDEKLIDLLIKDYSAGKFTLKIILLFAAFALGIVAVMNPRKPGGADAVKRKGIDIAIALDVSKSMLAADPAPNRLERAKQFITNLMNEMPDDRIALILFAGKAYMQMPLTVDHGAAQLFVSSAGPDAVPQQGTVISDALEMSARVFDSKEKRFKTIILISDGEDHDENAAKTATALAEQGVMINTVGIGSPEGAVLIDPATGETKKDASGNTVISKLNEDILRTIAEKTNGIYLRLQSSEAAVTTMRTQLAQIDRKSFGDISLMNFTTYYPWFAAAMFLLLLVEIFIPEKRKVAA
jgi:Ca-activated chloride channel family protein